MKLGKLLSGSGIAAIILFSVLMLFGAVSAHASKDAGQSPSISAPNAPQEGQTLKGLFQNQQMSSVKSKDGLFGKPLKIYGTSLSEDEDCGCDGEEEAKYTP